MKVSVLCETIQATQVIAYYFDQSFIPPENKVDFQLHEWSELKDLDSLRINKVLFDCEYLILSRWYAPDHVLKVINLARENDKKIFLHLDDYLFSVPKSIGINKWLRYSSPKMLEALYAAAELTDGIIASTNLLADQIKSILPQSRVFILPYWRSLNLKIYNSNDFSKRPYPVVGYMGTQTHAEDLELISSDLDCLLDRNKSIVFETFGIDMPKALLQKYPDRCFALSKVESYPQFQSVLSSLGWWLGLAPLTQNTFNYCKTNTKFVEYIQAGIPVIASNFGPYAKIPASPDTTSEACQYFWLKNIEHLLFSKRLRDALFESQLNYCRQFSDPKFLVEFYRNIAF